MTNEPCSGGLVPAIHVSPGHLIIGHAVEYVRGNVHTNGMKKFRSLFKRALKGTYVPVGPTHLDAYVVEQTVRFDERKDMDGARFRKVAGNVSGKRITYKELTGRGGEIPA
jgi:hypothetical protein